MSRAIVRRLAVIVPRDRRAEWLAEWEAELVWAEREAARAGEPPWQTSLRLGLRSLGAVRDALWLRTHDRAPTMLPLDVKYALRSLRRRPGFTLVALLTLALGIGATTAIFSVVDGVLLRPLALPQPDRVVQLEGRATDGNAEKVGAAMSYPDYLDFRTCAHAFADLAAIWSWQQTLTARDAEPARLDVGYVTDNWFRALGASAAIGRAVGADDVRPDAPPVAVLSHATWQTRFGGDRAIVGRPITLDGVPVTVVGIMPPNPALGRDIAIWRPLVPGRFETLRGGHRYNLIGRLRADVPLARAQSEVSTIARALEMQYPESNAKRGAHVASLRDEIVAPVRPALLVLLAAVALVLLVGCANLAGLLLARAAAREREMAVRSALGAGRGHILRQWMAESLLLTLGGGAAGAAVAWGGMRALLLFAPRSIPRADEVTIDGRVLLFLLAVSAITGLAFGALPALTQRAAATPLREARGATANQSRRRLRHLLVTGEIALATVLVSGAGLLMQSLWRLTHTDLRFRPEGVSVVHLQLPDTRYGSEQAVLAFDRIQKAVAAVPGVRSAALAYGHPLDPQWTSSYTIAGQPTPARGLEPEASIRPVTPGYFRSVGLRIVRGRDLSDRDRLETPGVVVVNEAFAKRHFGTTNPLGQRVDRREAWWKGQPTMFEIVGVVADEPFHGPGAPPAPALYFAHAQFPFNEMWLTVRHDGASLATLDPAVRRAVWSVDPTLPVESLRSMESIVADASAEPRFNALLLTLFATAALLLAAVGVYGVLSYTVAQRSAEIGVRIALGAPRQAVLRGVVREGLGLATLGLMIGVPGAIVTGRVLGAALEGVRSADPILLGAVAATLALVAVGSAWLPAWRASRVDPVMALRAD